MKVVGINGSARKDGNTAVIMRVVFDELESQGIETKLIQLAEHTVPPCKGCFACRGKGTCVFTDDDFCEIFEEVKKADGILLGSPVYSADVTSRMKAFTERGGIVTATNPGILKRKVCASVAAARRGGGLHAVDTMNHFLLSKECIIAGSTYWNMVYGNSVGEVLNDAEGIGNMKNLGQNMAWLLHKLHGAKS